MSLDYTKVTHTAILEEWRNRILSDERYKNLSQASIYSFFEEMLAGVMDLTNYYIQRTAEESYLDTARLDSSVIKLSHNLGYQPRRPVPAFGDISIEIRGPLPKTVKAGDIIWLNNEDLAFSFNGHDFMLDACYSYELTESDIANGVDPTWRKRIRFSVNGYESSNEGYITLNGKVDSISQSKLRKIRVMQAKRVSKVLDPITYSSQVGRKYQTYDIDDVKFTNYYGKRDPFANVNGEYDKRYGVTSVGIGKTEADAMNNLFSIEDEALELSPEIKYRNKKVRDGEYMDPVNVVCIKSNWDKTVRLYFGNGIDSCPGLTSTDESIFVKYLITDGSDANYPDAADSELRVLGKVYASGEGRVTNISNNVSFIFDSAIHGGSDFESRDSMDRNSKIYFASNSKLITLPDYMSYLLTITDPINVKNAIAFGEEQIEAVTQDHDGGRTNIVLYTIFSDIYRRFNGLYRPINMFSETEDMSSSSMYIDYSTYMNHLFDFVSYLVYPKGYTFDQYNDRSTFGQWCKQIRDDCKDRIMLNTKIISMPPIFHYYDVVGDVIVDRHVDMSKFKEELENALYEWLAESTSFNTQIFKSDIYNKILENPGAKKANIDIKVSELIKGSTKTYRFKPGDARANQNILILPQKDISGTDVREVFSDMRGRDITLQVQSDDAEAVNYRIEEVSIDSNNAYLSLNGEVELDQSFYTDVIVDEDSFFTKNRLTESDPEMIALVREWLASRPVQNGTDARPIDLPYTISVDANPVDSEDLVEIIRDEQFKRKGANSTNLSKNLSEDSFCFALREYINQNPSRNYDIAKNNFNYVYPALKQIFDDNVLDDDNNIVNYSSSREIPVLRLRLRYRNA